jgi:hypothetical protein
VLVDLVETVGGSHCDMFGRLVRGSLGWGIYTWGNSAIVSAEARRGPKVWGCENYKVHNEQRETI